MSIMAKQITLPMPSATHKRFVAAAALADRRAREQHA